MLNPAHRTLHMQDYDASVAIREVPKKLFAVRLGKHRPVGD
jgi:hypothetical protein